MPEELAGFDRVVFATGARYRYGLGGLVTQLLNAGWGRSGPIKRLFGSSRLRDWFYYRARRGTGDGMKRLARQGQKVTVIGDAARAGKGKEAINDAYRAALGGHNGMIARGRPTEGPGTDEHPCREDGRVLHGH